MQRALLPVKGLAPPCGGTALSVCFRLVRPVQQIIHGHIIKIREADQNSRGNIHVAALVIAVDALAARKELSHFPLRQISVLPQCADPLVHAIILRFSDRLFQGAYSFSQYPCLFDLDIPDAMRQNEVDKLVSGTVAFRSKAIKLCLRLFPDADGNDPVSVLTAFLNDQRLRIPAPVRPFYTPRYLPAHSQGFDRAD